MGSNDSSDHGDLMLTAEPATGSKAQVDDDAASPEQQAQKRIHDGGGVIKHDLITSS